MARPRASGFSIVLTTCSKRSVATAITTNLLSRRLAACVQMIPIRSHYVWKGRATTSRELLLVIKARRRSFAAVGRAIAGAHDYEVPEIVQVPLSGAAGPYLRWLAASTR